MHFLISILILLIACLDFENKYSIDRDGDGISIYDGDCNDNDISITLAECTDDDGDGQNEFDGDCDDGNAFIYTGAAYIDNPNLCMKDVDGDGFGDANAPDGVLNGTDCDDDRDDVNPDAKEYCDGLDNNCNSEIDEEPVDGIVFYADQDGDGFGSMNATLVAKLCQIEDGYVDNNEDCKDTDSKIME
jgi:hypothetical protein